ncbi:MAG: hypothetical protein AB7O26_06055 [Planctomycetaceae bacterium]
MAHAYTPGLKVAPRVRHRARRVLPIAGDVLVKVGDVVGARDVVAQTHLPGDVQPVNLANALSIAAGEVPHALLKQVGDRIEIGETIARSKGMFGFFQHEYKSKVAGQLESISEITGQLIIRGAPTPVQVLAYLSGRVVEVMPNEGVVVEADVALVQGIFGIGGEAFGKLRKVCSNPRENLTPDKLTADMRGMIVVGGARVTGDALKKAVQLGIAAVVSGGLDDSDLRELLGYDLGVAITGSERVGITLVITEGFGDIAMAERTFALLTSHDGKDVSVNGSTQIRAGVLRPEIVIPLGAETGSAKPDEELPPPVLEIGRPVRVIRDPYFGKLGTVAALPHELRVLDSESRARVLEVSLEGGEKVTVPRANVELVEG